MRLPFLVVLGVGRGRYWLPVPVPVFVFWPVVVLLLVAEVAGRRLTWRRGVEIQTLLRVLGSLSGLRVEVVGAAGGRFLLWIV